MKLILQLSLIVILWNHAAIQVHGAKCVTFKNIDLRIPDNSSIVNGEKSNPNDTWYQHINWIDTPAGDLKVNVSLEYCSQRDPSWHEALYSGVVRKLFLNDDSQWNGFCKWLGKALGLTPLGPLRTRVRVPSSLFSEENCVDFPPQYRCMDGYLYRIPVEVTDDDDNKILTGYVSFVA